MKSKETVTTVNLRVSSSKGVYLVVHQLGENPPIIILRYTLHQVVDMLALMESYQSNCLSPHRG